MKRALALSLGLFASVSCFAQDLGGGGRLLPSGSTMSSSSNTSSGSSLNWKVEEKDNRPLLETRQPSLSAKSQFVDANAPYVKELNDKLRIEKVTPSSMPIATNGGSLGYINTESPYVMLRCRDFGEVDGDMIRVWVNGKLVMEKLRLDASYAPIRVELEPGRNTIEFEALNVGAVAPNTAQLNVTDENGQSIGGGGWNLDTGASATLSVIRR